MASNFFKNFFGVGDSTAEDYYDNEPAAPAPSAKASNNVVSMKDAQAAAAGNPSTIALFEPRMFGDTKEIATQLLSGQAAIINFDQMDNATARRVVDFMNGAVYAIDGDIQRVGKEIFLCTPANFQIDGKLSANIKASADQL